MNPPEKQLYEHANMSNVVNDFGGVAEPCLEESLKVCRLMTTYIVLKVPSLHSNPCIRVRKSGIPMFTGHEL